MDNIAALLSNIFYLLLWACEITVWARVILTAFSPSDDSVLVRVLVFFSEPILLPFRAILDNFDVGGGIFDLSPVLATVVITIFMSILPAVTI